MKEVFNDIIEKDEKVIKVFKPQKNRFWWGLVLHALMITLGVGLWLSLIMPGILAGDELFASFIFILLAIYAIVVLLVLIFVIIFGGIAYRNRFYAYSNKRILIRSGVIGVDYSTLEFQAMTATIVKVSFLDKLLGTKTGTINFGSPSSPVGAGSGKAGNLYSFRCIEKPYDTLKEIKEFMDTK